jgi:hypothetical protein
MPEDVVDLIVSYKFILRHNEGNLQMSSIDVPLASSGDLYVNSRSWTVKPDDGTLLKRTESFMRLDDPLLAATVAQTGNEKRIHSQLGNFKIVEKRFRRKGIYCLIDEDVNAFRCGRVCVKRVLYASHTIIPFPNWSFFYSSVGLLQRADCRKLLPGQPITIDPEKVPISEVHSYSGGKLDQICVYVTPSMDRKVISPAIVCKGNEVIWYPRPAADWLVKATPNLKSNTGYDSHLRISTSMVVSRLTDANGVAWRCRFLDNDHGNFVPLHGVREGTGADHLYCLKDEEVCHGIPALPKRLPRTYWERMDKVYDQLCSSEEQLIGSHISFWRNTVKTFFATRDDVSAQAIALTRL